MRNLRRGNILTENIIFIILNLVFLAILILFLFSKMGAAAVLEERYAKEIALLIDSGKPSMAIYLDMDDAIKVAIENGLNPDSIVNIEGNIVTVRLSEDGGYSYSFFNGADVTGVFDRDNKGRYVFSIYES